MSHVDDGILHALLDGALGAADPAEAERVELHLAACADCRARLSDAARLRDEAGALLASARPRAVATPPFDEIRARARSAAAAGNAPVIASRRHRAAVFATPFNGLAWAATVVLAVGLGWLLHDTIEQPEQPQRIGAAEAVTAVPEMATESLAAADLSMDGVVGGQDGNAGLTAGAGAPHSLAGTGPTDQTVSEERTTARPQAPPPPPALQAQAERPAEYDVVESAESGAAATGAGVADAAAAAPVPAAVAPTVAERADGWRASSAEQAGRLVGGLIRIAGAELLDVSTRTTAAGVEVRSVQMTDRGETLTLVQRSLETERRVQSQRAERRTVEGRVEEGARRDAVAAEAVAPAPVESALPSVVVQIGERVVTISGAVEPARLDEIAAGLR